MKQAFEGGHGACVCACTVVATESARGGLCWMHTSTERHTGTKALIQFQQPGDQVASCPTVRLLRRLKAICSFTGRACSTCQGASGDCLSNTPTADDHVAPAIHASAADQLPLPLSPFTHNSMPFNTTGCSVCEERGASSERRANRANNADRRSVTARFQNRPGARSKGLKNPNRY